MAHRSPQRFVLAVPEDHLPADADENKALTPRPRLNQYTSPPKDLNAFRNSLRSGTTLMQAMTSAGFPMSAARQGVRKLPSKFLKVLLAEKKQQIELARQFSPAEVGDYVMGGLLANTMNGEDKAVRSYELLGKAKAVGLFTPDAQLGVVVITMPEALANNTTSAAVSTLCLDGDAT